MESSNKEFISSDGKKYVLTVTEDIVQLSDNQIAQVGKKISNLTSKEILEKGVSLNMGSPTQQNQVIAAIDEILKDLNVSDILDLKLIDFTYHAGVERISDEVICIEREWNHERAEEEVAECLKYNIGVDQLRIRFNSRGSSWDNFAFRVSGYVENLKQQVKRVVISFQSDPLEEGRTILVITILD